MSSRMEKFIEVQTKRTELLLQALEIVKIFDNPAVEHLCNDIRDSIKAAEGLLERRAQLLSQKKKLNQEFVDLTTKCNALGERTEEINQELFPEQSIQSLQSEPAENIDAQNSVNGRNLDSFEVSPCPSTWCNGALDTPMPVGNNFRQLFTPTTATQQPFIKPLHPNEMVPVPTYMKGRLTCESVNSFVMVFNSALKQKYSIVQLKRKDVKRKDLVQYCTWKSQEQEYKMKGQIYLTAEDLTNLCNFKMDKSSDKITQILRHTNRLRQSFAGGKVIIYIVVT